MDLELVETLASLDPALVGRRLRAARIAAGLTQPQACADAASVGYLSRIERGDRRAGPELLEKLCRSIGVSVELIIRGTEPGDPREWECELDFAELEVVTGMTSSAARRVAELMSDERLSGHQLLLERARLVKAKTDAAHGANEQALAGFESVMAARTTRSAWVEAASGLSRLLRETGDLAGSIKVAQHVLDELGDSTSDREAVTKMSMNLAAATYESGDVDRALRLCRQAIAAAEATNSPTSRAAAYWNTAIIACESGDLDEALALTRRALALFADVEDARLEARLRTQLGIFLLRAEPSQAEEALEQLRTAQTGYRLTDADVADVLHNQMALARAHFAIGDIERAQDEATAVLADATQLPFVAATAGTLLGRIARVRNDVEAARAHLIGAVRSLSAVGADRRAAQQWFTLASLLDEMGLSEEAKEAFRRAAVSTGLTPSYGAGHTSDATVTP